VNKKIAITTSSGKFLFGILQDVKDDVLFVKFLNSDRILTIPINSVEKIREFENADDYV